MLDAHPDGHRIARESRRCVQMLDSLSELLGAHTARMIRPPVPVLLDAEQLRSLDNLQRALRDIRLRFGLPNVEKDQAAPGT